MRRDRVLEMHDINGISLTKIARELDVSTITAKRDLAQRRREIIRDLERLICTPQGRTWVQMRLFPRVRSLSYALSNEMQSSGLDQPPSLGSLIRLSGFLGVYRQLMEALLPSEVWNGFRCPDRMAAMFRYCPDIVSELREQIRLHLPRRTY